MEEFIIFQYSEVSEGGAQYSFEREGSNHVVLFGARIRNNVANEHKAGQRDLQRCMIQRIQFD